MKLSEIEKGFEQFYPNGEKCEFTAHAAAQICEVIMKPKWISVDDFLPLDRDVVIIFWIHENKNRITSGSYNHYGKYWQHGAATQIKVTHWMSLPDAPISTTEA